MAALEVLAVATALASVWLLVRLNIWNWPAGLVSVCCYAVLFLDAKLYADALLQIVFFALGVSGWLRWLRGDARGEQGRVTRASPGEWRWAAGIAAAGIPAIAVALHSFTDSPLPLADAAIFVLSLVAIRGQALRRIECWWVWILVDVISIPVYAIRGLPLTAALYAVFLLLCIGGLMAWRPRLA
jgi:nicotinamide mononucleotide transporter